MGACVSLYSSGSTRLRRCHFIHLQCRRRFPYCIVPAALVTFAVMFNFPALGQPLSSLPVMRKPVALYNVYQDFWAVCLSFSYSFLLICFSQVKKNFHTDEVIHFFFWFTSTSKRNGLKCTIVPLPSPLTFPKFIFERATDLKTCTVALMSLSTFKRIRQHQLWAHAILYLIV